MNDNQERRKGIQQKPSCRRRSESREKWKLGRFKEAEARGSRGTAKDKRDTSDRREKRTEKEAHTTDVEAQRQKS